MEDIPDEPEVLSSDVLHLDDLALLIEKDTGWTKDVTPLIPNLLRRGGKTVLKFWRPNWRFPVVL